MGLFKGLFSSDDKDKNENNAQGDDSLPMPDFDFPFGKPIEGELVEEAPPRPVTPPPPASNAPVVSEPEPLYEPEPIGEEPVRGAEMGFVAGSNELPADAVEIMRIWRDASDGSLIIQMGDTLFQTVSELRDRGKAKRFINVVQQLAQIAAMGAKAAGLPRPNFEASANVVSQPGAWASSQSAAPIPPPQAPTAPAAPVITFTPNQSTIPPTPPEELGIAGQINRFLQARLEETPIFAGRHIKMGASADGGIMIQVDNEFYEGVYEVRDREVREFIMQVVRQWEDSHG